MRLIGLLCVFSLIWPMIAAADWVHKQSDDGGYVYGSAQPEGVAFYAYCLARSAQNRPLIEVGAHEIAPMDPFQMRLELSDPLIPTRGTRRDDIILWLDGTGYQLPPVWFSELNGVWAVDINMADPVVSALRRAQSFVLTIGADASWQMPVGNIDAAVQAAMRTCVERWSGMGHAVPAALSEFWTEGQETAAAPVSGEPLWDAVWAYIVRGCSGTPSVPDIAILTGNLDGDDQEDIVVDWREIKCPGANPQPFCGASMCSADVFLSGSFERSGQPEQLLALGVGIVPLSNGNFAVRTGGTLAMCQPATSCHFFWYWNGQAFDQLK